MQIASKRHLVDLAERRRGQRVYNRDTFRRVYRALPLLDVADQRVRFDGVTSPQDNRGDDGLAPVIVRYPDDRCHGDRCVISERIPSTSRG